MTLDEFATVFKDGGVRARLDWERLAATGRGVRTLATRSADDLAGLFTVWYRTPDGARADWRAPGSRPLRVGEAAEALGIWSEDRRARILAFRRRFERSTEPVLLVLPAYEIASGGALVIDGTHRAVAARLARADVRLVVFAAQGPVDAGILPDLAHHSGRPPTVQDGGGASSPPAAGGAG